MPLFSGAEVAKHRSRESCWIVIHSKVYDVTDFVNEHPGGAVIILKQGGAVRVDTALFSGPSTKLRSQ
jgi:L-lactate dehydrogenase (cytochrome)